MLIDLLKVLYCTPFLLYSCYTDIHTRRVPDRVWKVMLAGGALFVAYDLWRGGIPALVILLISAVFLYAFSEIVFRLGGFGGADGKSLIVLAIIIPTYPEIALLGRDFPLTGAPLLNLFAFSVFGNAVLLTAVVPLYFLVYNLFTLSPKEIMARPGYAVVGFKADISQLLGRHIKLIEEYSLEDGRICTKFRRRGADIDDGVVEELESFAASGLIDRRVWVTPGLPFMIPITLGFLTAVIFGDLIFFITKLLLIS